MEIEHKDNGLVRITPTNEADWLFNGNDVFGKVVNCKEELASVWQEVTDEFKQQWEAEHPEEEPTNE